MVVVLGYVEERCVDLASFSMYKSVAFGDYLGWHSIRFTIVQCTSLITSNL